MEKQTINFTRECEVKRAYDYLMNSDHPENAEHFAKGIEILAKVLGTEKENIILDIAKKELDDVEGLMHEADVFHGEIMSKPMLDKIIALSKAYNLTYRDRLFARLEFNDNGRMHDSFIKDKMGIEFHHPCFVRDAIYILIDFIRSEEKGLKRAMAELHVESLNEVYDLLRERDLIDTRAELETYAEYLGAIVETLEYIDN